MEEKKTFFDYIGQVFCCFGFTMICMAVLTVLFGEDAKGISTMFALSNKGIPVEIMAQYLLLSALIVFARFFFFTDMFLKKGSIVLRTIGMLLVVVSLIACFIYLFDWFPVHMWQPWVMFFICFFICFGISLAVTILKERIENKKMEEGLKKLQKQWEVQDKK